MQKIKLVATVFVIIVGFHFQNFAQSNQRDALNSQEKEIMQVVVDVFDGMRAGDSAAVKKHFYPQVSANTALTSKDGKRELKIDNINNWFNAIAKPHDQIWDERLWDYEVQIDGNLAAVWVKYAFYLDKDFHHCGVDALQLAHDGAKWRVFHLADTRQITGCEIPQHIANGSTF